MPDAIKIIIAGRNVGGFGGTETVFRSFCRLLAESEKNYQVSFVFLMRKIILLMTNGLVKINSFVLIHQSKTER